MKNISTSIKYGVLAGIIMITIMMLFYAVSMSKLATMWMMVVYIPLLFLMIWGGITYRKEVGGYASYGQAFMVVFVISLTATMLFDTFGYVLYAVIDPDLPEFIKKEALRNTEMWMERYNTPQEKIDETLAQIEEQDYTPSLKGQMIRYASSLFIGLIFSALIALFVRRPDQQAAQQPLQ